jgi:hypothetical protein
MSTITINGFIHYEIPEGITPREGDVGRAKWGHSYFYVKVFKRLPGFIYWRKVYIND